MKFRLPRKKKKQLKKTYFVAWRAGYSCQRMALELHLNMIKLKRRISEEIKYGISLVHADKSQNNCQFKGIQHIINKKS